MKRLKLKEYIIYAAIILGGVALDQLTKIIATKYLEPIGTVEIIKGLVDLTYHTNNGMAFGMLGGHRWIFMSVSTIMIAAIGYLLFSGRLETRLHKVSCAMIISGGIGNMIDRVAFGEVVDFIDFSDIGFSAIFNVADSIVCIGAGILVLALILDIARESKKKKEKAPTEEDGASGDAK